MGEYGKEVNRVALEVMQSIHQAEAQADRILEEAAEQARLSMKGADEEIARMEESYAEQAVQDARQKMSLAEQEAAEAVEASGKKNEEACERIRRTGEEHLDQAVERIVERIVSSVGHR